MINILISTGEAYLEWMVKMKVKKKTNRCILLFFRKCNPLYVLFFNREDRFGLKRKMVFLLISPFSVINILSVLLYMKYKLKIALQITKTVRMSKVVNSAHDIDLFTLKKNMHTIISLSFE